MKTKYKWYILIYCWTVSAIAGLVSFWFIARNPDKTYLLGGIAAVLYFIALVIGNRTIAKFARQDPPEKSAE